MSLVQRSKKLYKLLENSPEAYYWLGFLFADGHFTQSNRLILSLSIKDKEQLEKFIKFIGIQLPIKIKNNQCRIAVMDVDTLSI